MVTNTNCIRAFWSVVRKNPACYLEGVYTKALPFRLPSVSFSEYLYNDLPIRRCYLLFAFAFPFDWIFIFRYVIWASPASQVGRFETKPNKRTEKVIFSQYMVARHLHHQMRIGKNEWYAERPDPVSSLLLQEIRHPRVSTPEAREEEYNWKEKQRRIVPTSSAIAVFIRVRLMWCFPTIVRLE